MAARFNTVCIIGVGLLGGSLGLALKSRGLANRVTGVGRRAESLDVALAAGQVDEVFLKVEEGAAGADLIVIATPAAAVFPCLDSLKLVCDPTAVVTDVASTKGDICAHARSTWSEPCYFVGSHPMAGSEQWGPEHATTTLYENSVVFVEAGGHIHPDARSAVDALWTSVGAEVVEVDPKEHDRIVARTSHGPHILSAVLAKLAAREGNVQKFIGNGFRDATRIAGGRPEVWRDILFTNGPEILEVLGDAIDELDGLKHAIEDGDSERVMDFLEDALKARREMVDP